MEYAKKKHLPLTKSNSSCVRIEASSALNDAQVALAVFQSDLSSMILKQDSDIF